MYMMLFPIFVSSFVDTLLQLALVQCYRKILCLYNMKGFLIDVHVEVTGMRIEAEYLLPLLTHSAEKCPCHTCMGSCFPTTDFIVLNN